MIKFQWVGVVTTAEVVDGSWQHGLPEVAAMLETIAAASKPNAEQLAAERLGGVVTTNEPEN